MPLGDSAREMKSLDFLGDHLPPPAAHGMWMHRSVSIFGGDELALPLRCTYALLRPTGEQYLEA